MVDRKVCNAVKSVGNIRKIETKKSKFAWSTLWMDSLFQMFTAFTLSFGCKSMGNGR